MGHSDVVNCQLLIAYGSFVDVFEFNAERMKIARKLAFEQFLTYGAKLNLKADSVGGAKLQIFSICSFHSRTTTLDQDPIDLRDLHLYISTDSLVVQFKREISFIIKLVKMRWLAAVNHILEYESLQKPSPWRTSLLDNHVSR